MASAKVLEFGFDLDFAPMSFSDLAKHFEDYLERAKNLADLERLIKTLNPALKDSRYSEDERHELKKLRQRAYDRRRYSKLQNLDSLQIVGPDQDSKSGLCLEAEPSHDETPSEVKLLPSVPPMPAAALHMSSPAPQVAQQSDESSEGKMMQHMTPDVHHSGLPFWSGVKHAFALIDGEQVALRLPALLLLLASTSLVIWFLWTQSVELYEAVGFTSPQHTAAGGLLMVVGFAAIQSLTRSKMALLLCLYAGAYESFFMFTGTLRDEQAAQVAMVNANPDLKFLRDTMERARTTYLMANARYQQKDSDVFMNSWFKKSHLDPAWIQMEKAKTAVDARETLLQGTTSRTDVILLKLLYRLGIVLLSMILVHRVCQARNYKWLRQLPDLSCPKVVTSSKT